MKLHCEIHPTAKTVIFCPACRGSARSKKKAASSRINGRLGGRPRTKRRKSAKAAA